MPENVKEKNIAKKKSEESAEKDEKSSEDEARSYYYDDACGYEVYNPNEDEENDL